jgi:hypothetical protein
MGTTISRLVQLGNGAERRVALVEEPRLRLLRGFHSVHALATEAIRRGESLSALAGALDTEAVVDYDSVYHGSSEWRLLPPVDHPQEPARCLVSGTGLTHLGSASDRQAMHHRAEEELTDSMRMFRWGLQGGRPEEGRVGVAPEWFYKGNGTILRAHGEPLEVPGYAEDGGEEAEIAGIYLIGPDATPYRLGLTAGNEFSDHRFERKNYLNLAGSKIRTCSTGPELVLNADFRSVSGRVTIERGGGVLWSRDIRTGEEEMCHSLRNLEHHHFKFETHRRPGDVHVHFFGAHSLSFGDGLELADGDVMVVHFAGYGRALRNPVATRAGIEVPVHVRSLG